MTQFYNNKYKTIVSIVLISITLNLNAQILKMGKSILGTGSEDRAGSSVALSADGYTAIIGSVSNNSSGINAGQARVFKYNGNKWIQLGSNINAESASNLFGHSVDISDNGLIVAIGAPSNPGGGSVRGHVRVFKYINNDWVQQGADIDGEANNDQSGNSISLSSDGLTIAIGALANDGANVNSNKGHVRIYQFNNNTWTQVGTDIDGENNGDLSGASVSLSGDGSIVAISAPNNSPTIGIRSGHVRIYKNINGIWTKQGNDIDGDEDGEKFGSSVSISNDGNIVAIGSMLNKNGTNNQYGSVKVYKYTNGTWTQHGSKLIGKGIEDEFGISVSLSADGLKLAIGAERNDDAGNESGHVRVYQYINNDWDKIGEINGDTTDESSGGSVALSSDGFKLIIGSKSYTANSKILGKARIFEFNYREINLKSNNINIVSGSNNPNFNDSTDFGNSLNSISRKFTIFNNGINLGKDTLIISSIDITGVNASNFTLSNVPNKIVAGDSASFYITFLSSTLGTKTATVIINSNDEDEDVYNFNIKAKKIGLPNISIKGNNTIILNGDNTPSISDNTDFGNTEKTSKIFKIFNSGNDTLKITKIESTGAFSSEFELSNVPKMVLPSDSSSFTITFLATNNGLREATILVSNNDLDESSYNFGVKGFGINSVNVNTNSLMKSVHIYPNPFSDKINVDLTNIKHKISKISLIDCTGKTILEKVFDTPLIELDLSEIENGLYYVNIFSNNEIKTFKIIKQ